MKALIFLLTIIISSNSFSAEADTSDPWCEKQGGVKQYYLSDRTRIDCLMDYYAVEADFASKWYEAIGQSLHYANMTGKLPGILLIRKNYSDRRYVRRLYSVINTYQLPITVWVVDEFK